MSKPPLVNAEELAAANPDSFDLYPRSDRETLRVGDLVKVSDGRDRFWCRIEWRGVKIDAGAAHVAYAAVVLNDTAYHSAGSCLAIKPENVYDIDAATPRAGLRSTLAEN